MQTDRNDMKIEQSVSMHSPEFERPCKHQIVTDTKSRNASHLADSGICKISNCDRSRMWHQNTECHIFNFIW